MNNWYIRNGKVLMNSNGKLRGCCCESCSDWSVHGFTASYYASTSNTWTRTATGCPSGTMYFSLKSSRNLTCYACGNQIGIENYVEGGYFAFKDYSIQVPAGCQTVGISVPINVVTQTYLELGDWHWEPSS